jgi:hypothetical protein
MPGGLQGGECVNSDREADDSQGQMRDVEGPVTPDDLLRIGCDEKYCSPMPQAVDHVHAQS